MNTKEFKFELGSTAIIKASGETGEVVGRAQYIHGPDQYQLRYVNAAGVATEIWWEESTLH